jgi:hypothetical protein
MASQVTKMNMNNPLFNWLLATIIVVCLFYGLNHVVMSMQGLPLNFDLTPVQ